MNNVVINKIPVEANIEKLLPQKNFEADSPIYYEYLHAADIFTRRIQPIALLKACEVEAISGNTILIDGHVYRSKMLRHLLNDNQTVFLYLLTMGEMPADLTRTETYFVHSLKLPVMVAAMQQLKKLVRTEHHIEKIGMVNPGLIPDWSLQANQAIFTSFGSAPQTIGMEITKHSMMRPLYSSSGILFEDFQHYCECETCTIDACIGRESRFNQTT